MLDFCWHYLLCAAALYGCWRCCKAGRFGPALALTVLMVIVSAVGFFEVYSGPFVESGKSFAAYVDRYALFSLPVFLFPLAGLSLTVFSRRK